MRIIAGLAGGLQLIVPKTRLRPTMDRVKAAIFSSLGDAVIGANVLDLFAGSGALGIEALSRGAKAVLFIDEDRQSVAAIEQNLSKAKLQGAVRRQNVFDFLKQVKPASQFRLIFADPPYERMKSGEQFTKKLLGDENLPLLLEAGGIFILEKRPAEEVFELPRWNIVRAKTYGATEVLMLSAK